MKYIKDLRGSCKFRKEHRLRQKIDKPAPPSLLPLGDLPPEHPCSKYGLNYQERTTLWGLRGFAKLSPNAREKEVLLVVLRVSHEKLSALRKSEHNLQRLMASIQRAHPKDAALLADPLPIVQEMLACEERQSLLPAHATP